MPQFLVLAKRNTERFSDADFAPHLESEADHARKLYSQGVVRQIFGRADLPGAVLILEAASLEDARSQAGTLPLVQKEMLDIEVIPLVPYRGFAPRG